LETNTAKEIIGRRALYTFLDCCGVTRCSFYHVLPSSCKHDLRLAPSSENFNHLATTSQFAEMVIHYIFIPSKLENLFSSLSHDTLGSIAKLDSLPRQPRKISSPAAKFRQTVLLARTTTKLDISNSVMMLR
jgi:hypothetical protein